MEWMLMPYRRYAEFHGRSRRKEYWLFVLFTSIVTVLTLLLFGLGGAAEEAGADGLFSSLGGILILLFVLVSFIPSLAVQVRRLHDQDRTGWWLLLNVVPLGGLVLFVFMLMEGTAGPNRFGPDPKGRGPTGAFG